ncbi:hypothetical protein DEAC_c13960 [Desulfosporosinus acididurans]|uniref:Uncharacterized protein n=1 Tax=Desulfosporosinus acididurans TaxID=476652 RepID=A0A0J1FUQ4_9FIRM|nr:hypothetical protein [Desulfosporosinus acididurans]KLU66728.1 hypothetical protein DEAC_c13960 [Desulfosporosinus acididurans]
MANHKGRSYGTVLIDNLVRDKTKTEASPCVRYFVDKDGNPITQPEEYVPERSPIMNHQDYWKAAESLKGNKNAVINKPTKEQLAEDIKTMGNEEIAKKYNMGRSTIARYLCDYGLKRDEEYHKNLAEKKNEADNQLEHIPESDCAKDGKRNDHEENLGGQKEITSVTFCRECGELIVPPTENCLCPECSSENAALDEDVNKIEAVYESSDNIESMWKVVESDLNILLGLYMEKAEKEFEARKAQMFGGARLC